MSSAVEYIINLQDYDLRIYSIAVFVLTPVTVIALRKLLPGFLKRRSHSVYTDKVISGCLIALLLILNANVWYFLTQSIIKAHSEYSSSSAKSFNLLHSPVTKESLNQPYEEFSISGFSFLEVGSDDVENFKCSHVVFHDDHTVKSTKPKSLDQKNELRLIRKRALHLNSTGEYPIIRNYFLDKEGESEDEILKNKWYKFCGSAVWMDKYQVYFFVSRVIYSERSLRNKPTISLPYAQVFDKNWKEINDYEFPQSDIKFPAFLPIAFDEHPEGVQLYLGADDPRVILRNYLDPETNIMEQEPVIVFNSDSAEIDWKRAIHTYRPFTNSKKALRLKIRGMEPRKIEKNWAPFFDEDYSSINFVYSFNPIRVIKCDIVSGECDKQTGPEFEGKKIPEIRGGTNIVRVPPGFLPKHLASTREYWFGIARSHDFNCGCLKVIYRPHSFLISRALGSSNYTLDYVSSLFDFNIDTEAWNSKLEYSKCKDGKSVLIPNSISSWDIIPKDDGAEGELEDVMGITISEADRNNKIVYVKGFLKHINTVIGGEKAKSSSHYSSGDTVAIESNLLGKCATSLADEYCLLTAKRMNWKL
ncbi:hypothetical protein G9P44_004286 [Scheffersomyces stipitis]|nr:hypothetical protein G9P44_004286 [Scheffersomyces stipitis]